MRKGSRTEQNAEAYVHVFARQIFMSLYFNLFNHSFTTRAIESTSVLQKYNLYACEVAQGSYDGPPGYHEQQHESSLAFLKIVFLLALQSC